MVDNGYQSVYFRRAAGIETLLCCEAAAAATPPPELKILEIKWTALTKCLNPWKVAPPLPDLTTVKQDRQGVDRGLNYTFNVQLYIIEGMRVTSSSSSSYLEVM